MTLFLVAGWQFKYMSLMAGSTIIIYIYKFWQQMKMTGACSMLNLKKNNIIGSDENATAGGDETDQRETFL